MTKCLSCYQPLQETDLGEYHAKCRKTLFGQSDVVDFDLDLERIDELAKDMVRRQLAVTGVQPKLSLELHKEKGHKPRLTLVNVGGRYILKPPHAQYPNLPENEDLMMHLAEDWGLVTAKHTLVRLKSGELAYLAHRFDRSAAAKPIHQEDFCQLSERLTEDKYKSSLEQVAKLLLKYSTQPGIDAQRFYELCVFCYITGNADMHLKNFSLQYLEDGTRWLSPAYDLVCTRLAMPKDEEQTALTLNGKKKKLLERDWAELAKRLYLTTKYLTGFKKRVKQWQSDKLYARVEDSFLPDSYKTTFLALVSERLSKLGY
jgi:serine/threonine-protein kinase HipA